MDFDKFIKLLKFEAMKKNLLFIVMFLGLACVMNAQSYNFADFKLRPEIVSYVEQLKPADLNQDVKGTGINNAATFAEWSQHIPFLWSDLRPNGWLVKSGNPSANQSTGAYTGEYCLHVESNVTTNAILGLNDTLIGGVALVGNVSMSGLVQGEEYTQTVNRMRFYAKGLMQNQDSAIVMFQAWKAGEVVATGGFLLGANELTNDWQEFVSPIEILQSYPSDSAILIVTSSGVGIFQGEDIGTLTAGSYIKVDAFSLYYEDPSSINNEVNAKISVYPNPANEFVAVKNAKGFDITVSSINGAVVRKIENANETEIIDISDLSNGTYILNVNGENHKINVLR